MWNIRIWIILSMMCGVLGSCGRVEDLTVAEVGGRRITVQEYSRMAAKLLDHYYKDMEINLETKKKLLDTMIAKELLILEGLERGPDEDEQIVRKLERLRQRLLLKTLYNKIAGAIKLSDEEIERHFYEDGFWEEIRTSHVLCATEAEADEVLRELKNGASFEQLAKERSIHSSSA